MPYFFLISTRWYSLLSSSSPYYSFLLFSNLALFFPHFYSFIFTSFLILIILFVSFIYQSCLIFSSFLLVDFPFFPHPYHIIRFFYLPILPYFFLISTRWYSLLSSSSPYFRFFYLAILPYFFLISLCWYSLLYSSSPYYSFLLFTNLALFFPHFYSLIFLFFPHPYHIIRFFYLPILPYFFLISTRWFSLLSSSSPYYSFLLFSNVALLFPHFYSLIFPSFLILTILFVSFI